MIMGEGGRCIMRDRKRGMSGIADMGKSIVGYSIVSGLS